MDPRGTVDEVDKLAQELERNFSVERGASPGIIHDSRGPISPTYVRQQRKAWQQRAENIDSSSPR